MLEEAIVYADKLQCDVNEMRFLNSWITFWHRLGCGTKALQKVPINSSPTRGVLTPDWDVARFKSPLYKGWDTVKLLLNVFFGAGDLFDTAKHSTYPLLRWCFDLFFSSLPFRHERLLSRAAFLAPSNCSVLFLQSSIFSFFTVGSFCSPSKVCVFWFV